ncbi:MAG: hypothetical protein HY821_23595 [Acidobacteria bacterium]|nr:hypothetical protein [Acidobacteriota bacterium]
MPRQLALLLLAFPLIASDLVQLRRDFINPPVSYRPHTRWWWMGNALRKRDITYQLTQMQAQGIGGVEQISMQPVYEKGNVEFLSRDYFVLLNHAIAEAKARHMEFSLNFGGPGWIWGGDWVPVEFRNRNLVASFTDLEGAQPYSAELPLDVVQNPANRTESLQRIRPGDQLIAVVAARIEDGRLRAATLTDLTAHAAGRRLSWQVPPGRWRLMAFWSVLNGEPSIDHLSRAAMEFYCNHVGTLFQREFGAEFGHTVESLFMDSFEVPVFRNGLYWTPGFPEIFQRNRAYALPKYLPALWWDVDGISPKIRYDVNRTLHETGMDAFFDVFTGWCRRHGVKARIQPYGFVTDILQGAGAADIPEMEITAGEKDAVPWFDTRIGPRIYTASGARHYGRGPISVEAYTYLHWEQARDTLEELKIASDTFLRAGATKFYNHGYTATPEREFAPSRRFGAEMLLSDVNIWWPYYHLLSDYVARSSVLLRSGSHVADVAVYSPLANQWTRDVLNARRWTRDFDWGDLGRLLLANGYDFDLINDDVLQTKADLSSGRIRIQDQSYRILVLPGIQALPVETMRRIAAFVRSGGIAVAIDRLPDASTGFNEFERSDAEVRSLSAALFNAKDSGQGKAYFVPAVLHRPNVLDRPASLFDPFVNTLRRHVAPDFSIDLVRQGQRENNGLVFSHQSNSGAEVYFVSNIQDHPVDLRACFRVAGRAPHRWNPYTGEIGPLHEFELKPESTVLPLRLAPFESTFIVFSGTPAAVHVRHSDLVEMLSPSQGLAARNGVHQVDGRVIAVEGIPAPLQIGGPWSLTLDGRAKTLPRLDSWTADPATRNFSGTGLYQATFDLPASYLGPDLRLQLTLGDVGNIAEVEVNGRSAGIVWMQGQSLDVTRLVHSGANAFRVRVTNTLINRVSAWSKAPPLSPELAARYGRGLHDDDAQFRRLYGFTPLPRSGLLGPVQLTPFKLVKTGHKTGQPDPSQLHFRKNPPVQ